MEITEVLKGLNENIHVNTKQNAGHILNAQYILAITLVNIRNNYSTIKRILQPIYGR